MHIYFRSLICIFIVFLIESSQAQTITITSTTSSSNNCNNASFNVTYILSGSYSNTPTNNVFTVEMSDGTGSFASPTIIGSRTAINAGTINCTLPLTIATGSLYTIRVASINPAIYSTNILLGTINSASIAIPTVSNVNLCQGEAFTITYTRSCTFTNTPLTNTFSVQLSDASGNFSSPLTIGTLSSTSNGTINANIPIGTPAGSAYRVRVVSSNPNIISPDNGIDITVNAASGSPTNYGNGFWNVYVYNGFSFSGYYGYYTESNLSFDTQNRWGVNAGPGVADATSGSAYTGCPIGTTNYSTSMKRTNVPCNFYQLDINYQDDACSFWINGTKVWEKTTYSPTAQLNVWRGFISPSMNLEFQFKNGTGPGRLQATFTPVSGLTISAPTTICASTSTTITTTNSTGSTLTYSWSPAATIDNPNNPTVLATPPTTTTYTVSGTDVITGCSTTSSVVTTVNPLPSTAVMSTSAIICSGVTTAILTATGANTYSWSPASGLSSPTGYTVTATPSSTTTYIVSGSNNCATATASTTITVQNIPASPLTTDFGSGVWNIYCYNSTNFTNYYGYYTENNLNFNTTTRWNSNSGPTIANALTGLPYSGCTFPSTNYSITFKRTNFTCGYYQIDIPTHDDDYYILINGVQVNQHVGCCDAHSGVWTGFLGPSSTIELRLVNNNGPGSLQVSINAVSYNILSPPVTICAGTSTTISANNIVGATYNWSPTGSLATPTTYSSIATPTTSTTYSCTISDPGTGCFGTASVLVTVNPLPSTTVTPTNSTLFCSSSFTTLTATGANTYSWSPSTGLSSSTGYSVTATPSSTTVYTVTGNNNCVGNAAMATVTVIPLANPTTFPSGTWNVYCYNGFNTTALANYYGYYTENGTGASGYNFNTSTRWASGTAPSGANATNGLAYKGCALTANNWTMSFKRSNFACGVYTINILSHDDNITLYINGTQVAQHVGCCDAHTGIWTGTLSSSSTVEFVLAQGTGSSGLSITMVPVTQPANQLTWIGSTDNNWFNASNWCGTAVTIPTSTTDVLIPACGPKYMPSIGTMTAVCKNITINPAITSSTFTSALPSASLTITSSNELTVFGNWTNFGSFNSYQSKVTFTGTATNSLNCAGNETFYNLVIDNSNNVNFATGMHSIANNLQFVNGKIIQNSTFEIGNGASISNVSDNSYIEGTVRKTGNTAFTFPVGKNGKYRPISISAPAFATDHFTAQYFNTSPMGSYSDVLKDAILNHLGKCEYWLLNRTGGTSNVNVTLSWDNSVCMVNNPADLVVARFDAATSTWKNHGNGGTTGTIAFGTVTTAAPVTSFSPFTLGSISGDNPLPIQLLSFNAKQNKNLVALTWNTASELNNEYFTLEKSLDGIHYVAIGTIDGAGTTTEENNYSFNDEYPAIGKNYYRLLQTDLDGSSECSKTIVCNFEGNTDNAVLNVYPNPTDGTFTIIAFSAFDAKNEKRIIIENSLGETIYSKTIDGTINKFSIDALSKAPKGVYIVRLFLHSGSLSERLIVR